MGSTTELAQLLAGKSLAVLTGAGCSTESGIPDYRGPETRRRARNPIQYRAFVDDDAMRQRYWARSMVGWPQFRDKVPNAAHRAVAELERLELCCGVITQNVDRLHHRAGSEEVIELHGSLHEVRCLDCNMLEPREHLQVRLHELNPTMDKSQVAMAPDGDADLPDAWLAGFRVPTCLSCGGVLKPNVVFFGEGVPRERVVASMAWVECADALLVVGSSLAVFSGYRFVRHAHAAGKPVGIVNLGPTRGDGEATLRVNGLAGETLPVLLETLRASVGLPA